MTTDETRAAITAYYERISAGEIDAVLTMFASHAVMRDPVGMPPATDEVSRRQRYDGIALAFESFGIAPQQVIAGASEGAARWTATGKARSGRDVTFDGISTFVFGAEGRITEMSAYWDVTQIMAAAAGEG